MFYFTPTPFVGSRWEDMGYSQLVCWCFTGDVGKYYADYRWNGWQEDVKDLPGDKALQLLSFPFGRRQKAWKVVPVRPGPVGRTV